MREMQGKGQFGETQRKKLGMILRENKMAVFEYLVSTDHLIIYDEWMNIAEENEGYLANLATNKKIYEEDQWKITLLYKGILKGPEEVRMVEADGTLTRKQISICELDDKQGCGKVLIGSMRDVTKEKMRVKQLEDLVKRDTMTGLYNYAFGKNLINKYLKEKSKDASCGMLMVDIDNFKEVNDNYGHLFGDQVLIKLAELFKDLFSKSDILMRSGGDEFVILLKECELLEIEKRAECLLKEVQKLYFEGVEYIMKCSIGICFLDRNEEDYTYDSLFRKADEALYHAKENGRNQYWCCVI